MNKKTTFALAIAIAAPSLTLAAQEKDKIKATPAKVSIAWGSPSRSLQLASGYRRTLQALVLDMLLGLSVIDYISKGRTSATFYKSLSSSKRTGAMIYT